VVVVKMLAVLPVVAMRMKENGLNLKERKKMKVEIKYTVSIEDTEDTDKITDMISKIIVHGYEKDAEFEWKEVEEDICWKCFFETGIKSGCVNE
jgi:membrane-associated HD superfamily phosphohydrolase